jgi:hypothetical protein
VYVCVRKREREREREREISQWLGKGTGKGIRYKLYFPWAENSTCTHQAAWKAQNLGHIEKST